MLQILLKKYGSAQNIPEAELEACGYDRYKGAKWGTVIRRKPDIDSPENVRLILEMLEPKDNVPAVALESFRTAFAIFHGEPEERAFSGDAASSPVMIGSEYREVLLYPGEEAKLKLYACVYDRFGGHDAVSIMPLDLLAGVPSKASVEMAEIYCSNRDILSSGHLESILVRLANAGHEKLFLGTTFRTYDYDADTFSTAKWDSDKKQLSDGPDDREVCPVWAEQLFP